MRVLFVVSEYWYFRSHRLNLAEYLSRNDCEVFVASDSSTNFQHIDTSGVELVLWSNNRHSLGIFSNLLDVIRLWKIIRKVNPDIVHFVALKPIMFGILLRFFVIKPYFINAVAGLGSVFVANAANKNRSLTIFQFFIIKLLRFSKNVQFSSFIFQNTDDKKLIIGKANSKRSIVIRGAGVDPKYFCLKSGFNIEEKKTKGTNINVLMASRLIYSKGFLETVSSVERLVNDGLSMNLVLCGRLENNKPDGIEGFVVEDWNKKTWVTWLGNVRDIRAVLHGADICCLPTAYREGVPKILIEAASCGIPIVTSNTPGCNDIVKHGVNGLLVRPYDQNELYSALKTLAMDSDLRNSMGGAGRARVKEFFSDECVNKETIDFYKQVMGSR